MARVRIEIEGEHVGHGGRRPLEYRRQAGLAFWTMTLLAAWAATLTPSWAAARASAPQTPGAAQAKKPHLPYVTIDHPQLIPASQADFLAPGNLVIGVTDGKTSKAYPAAILAQHGVVQDRMADGPIAVTW